MTISTFRESYQPEIWAVKKDDIYAAIEALQSGIEYSEDALISHDALLGRTTHKNRSTAERMECDIEQMKSALVNLQNSKIKEIFDI